MLDQGSKIEGLELTLLLYKGESQNNERSPKGKKDIFDLNEKIKAIEEEIINIKREIASFSLT